MDDLNRKIKESMAEAEFFEKKQKNFSRFLGILEAQQDAYPEAEPFYNNHIFTAETLKKTRITWRERLWLWLWSTWVQIASDTEKNYAVFYKNVHGKYYLMKFEEL